VAEQIQIAQGETTADPSPEAMRLNVESTRKHNFRPAGGGSGYLPPGGPGVDGFPRLHRLSNSPTTTPNWQVNCLGTASTAINRMKRALRECALTGYLLRLFIKDPGDTGVFARVYTNFVEQVMLSRR